ncbi:Gfo/Idh/MocA family oxidoreductase [Hoeflea sp. CAU 1731]
MFRWGILSTAKIAREQLLPAIQDSDNGVVLAIASRDEARARALADRFGAEHAFGSYQALLDSDFIDGVYIPLPTSQHIEWSLKAAEAGKHVLCEKPIALHADEIDKLVEARDRLGVMISESFMVFYHPQWTKVQNLIADGAIGALRQVQGAFGYYNTDPSNMRNQVALGGGGLPDIGVYPTVTTRIVTGKEPARVRSTVTRDPNFGTDVYANVSADFGDFNLDFYCSTQLALRQHMVFHGEKGVIEVHAPFNAGTYGHAVVTLHNQDHTGAEVFRFPGVQQYRNQVETFVRAISGSGEALFSLENSKLNQKLIDAIYRAAEHDGWETI